LLTVLQATWLQCIRTLR